MTRTRWRSDGHRTELEEQGTKQVIVAFVTNGSWIDGNADSGIRACLAEEFSSIYILHLRGNASEHPGERSASLRGRQCLRSRVQGRLWLLLFLVKNPKTAGHDGCRIHYRDIGDYISREVKLDGSPRGTCQFQDFATGRKSKTR